MTDGLPYRWVMFVGLGDRKSLSAERLRKAMGLAYRMLLRKNFKKIAEPTTINQAIAKNPVNGSKYLIFLFLEALIKSLKVKKKIGIVIPHTTMQ